ncbi:MAG: hypothetical protein PQJ46_07565 [Spirochaetales bacterium]|nr:hypothetical protein [Spirochaetales bacterium]
MRVPDKTDKKWENAISDKSDYQLKFLATKILLGRLRLTYQNEENSESLKKNACELHDFFEKNQHVPAAMEDLQQIIGG